MGVCLLNTKDRYNKGYSNGYTKGVSDGKGSVTVSDLITKSPFTTITGVAHRGNYNFGDTGISWTASYDCFVVCVWAGNYSGGSSISVTSGYGGQIGGIQTLSSTYYPPIKAGFARVKKGGTISAGGSSSDEDHFSQAMFAIH